MVHIFDKRRFAWVSIDEAHRTANGGSTLLNRRPRVSGNALTVRQSIGSIIQHIRESMNMNNKPWTKLLILTLFMFNMRTPIIYLLIKLYQLMKDMYRMFSFRKMIYKILPHTKKIFPVWIQARLTEFIQPIQLSLAEEILTSLPDTGLYNSNESYDKKDVKVFRNFCDHIMSVFSKSPRSMLLNRIDAHIQGMLSTKPKVVELFLLLNLPPTTRFIKICESFDNLSPGKLYNRWQMLVEKSKKDQYTDELLHDMRNGFKQKAIKRGVDMSEDEISIEIKRIQEAAVKKRESMANEANEMWPTVEKDKNYVRWKEVQSIWYSPEFQINNMYCEFRALDKEVGEERRLNGTRLEEETAEEIFNIVRNRLLKKHPNLSRYKKWNYFTSADWTDSNGNNIGEIDVVIVVMGPKGYIVMALVEVKSNCFELAKAFQQHELKVSNFKNNSIIVRSKSQHNGPGSFHKWLINDVIDDTKLNLIFQPPIYVATLIPEHEYLMGASNSIVDVVSSGIFSGSAHFDNDEYIEQLMQRVKDTCDLSMSPVEALRTRKDKIIILI